MSISKAYPARQGRLAERLVAAQQRRFVGRAVELELFRSALQANEARFAVLHVYGPGGVGKTTLLAEFARAAEGAGAATVRLDGRAIEPTPEGFLVALRQAMGLRDKEPPAAALGQAEARAVLLIDTFETLSPLDPWLRETFLPQLPEDTLTVIAGRTAPSVAWQTDPGWSELARIVSLRNLPPDDSRAYLRARGIPEPTYQSVLEFTHGHPLALALVADLLSRGDQQGFSPASAPDVLRTLLGLFIQQVPSGSHRRALEICARTRVTTEALLADVIGAAEARELFEWLRGLSFVEQGPAGLFPHDLARDVLDSDLRWRDPDGFRELHRRVLRHLVQRLQTRTGRDQQRAYFDLVYLSRNSPLMRPYYDWKAM